MALSAAPLALSAPTTTEAMPGVATLAPSATYANGPLPLTKKVIVAQPAPKVPYDAPTPAAPK